MTVDFSIKQNNPTNRTTQAGSLTGSSGVTTTTTIDFSQAENIQTTTNTTIAVGTATNTVAIPSGYPVAS